MKDFNDFVNRVKNSESNNIYEKLTDKLDSEIKRLNEVSDLPEDGVMSIAIINSLKTFSLELLNEYHLWLHDESNPNN